MADDLWLVRQENIRLDQGKDMHLNIQYVVNDVVKMYSCLHLHTIFSYSLSTFIVCSFMFYHIMIPGICMIFLILIQKKLHTD